MKKIRVNIFILAAAKMISRSFRGLKSYNYILTQPGQYHSGSQKLSRVCSLFPTRFRGSITVVENFIGRIFMNVVI